MLHQKRYTAQEIYPPLAKDSGRQKSKVTLGVCPLTRLKVVGKAQATKSNSHNFWYRCLVLALIDVSEVLAQTLHDCMTYERKKPPKIRVKFQVQLIN